MKASYIRCLLVIVVINVAKLALTDASKTEQERIRDYQLRLQSFMRKERGETVADRKEPLQCYSCRNARSNEQCNKRGMVTCSPTQTTCQTEIRVANLRNMVNVRIRKGCKQERACTNNFIQNTKIDWPATQCNEISGTSLSVCRFCCIEGGCNKDIPDRICGEPQALEHGSVECRQDNFGSDVCNFKCDPCHKLTGSRVRMCMDNALWSGTEAKCTFDESLPGCHSRTKCPADEVLAPTHGSVECTNAANAGSECRFFCDRGYFLNGPRVLRCRGSDYRWDPSRADPLSIRPTCVRGDASQNPCHVFASFGYSPTSKLICVCNTGFDGDGFLTCNDVDECDKGQDLCDVNADCINTVGSYRCRCRDGYRGDGFSCADINECALENECDKKNGICINNDGNYTCTCKPGFIGNGKTCEKVSIACPGGFTDDVCIIEPTPTLPPLRDSMVVNKAQPVEGSTTPKPVASAPGDLTDDKDEAATDMMDMSSCVRVPEGKPGIVRDVQTYESLNENLLRKIVQHSNNTQIIYGPWIGLDDRAEPGVLRWRDGKSLTKSDFQMWAPGQPRMIDNDGFGNCVDLVSDPVGTQTTNFLWRVTLCSKPSRHICQAEESDVFSEGVDLCLPLGTFANGRRSCSDGWRPGSVCRHFCLPGYVLSGRSRITCDQETVTWNSDAPVCVRAICSRPLMPPNSGVMECSDENRRHSVCKFGCKPGYTLHGNDTVTCEWDLRWSSLRPCCRDDCPPYARMNLILVLDSSRSIKEENFAKIKDFAKAIHKRFEVSEDFTQVSVVTYHREVNLLNNITVYKSSDELDIALDDLPYEGAGTFIGQAINYVTENLIGLREGAGDIVVVLTDGISHDDVYFPSKNLHATGAHVIAVGVEHAWRYQLNLIASHPATTNVIKVESYTDLTGVAKLIGEKVCHLSC